MKREQVVGGVLVLLVVLIYGQVGGFDFINFDDPAYVSNNPQVLDGLTGAGIKWAFTTGTQANWHPVTWLSLMTDAQLFGPSPRGFHLTNVFFHALNTLLVLVLLYRLTGAFWRSAIVAALFAVHPLHIESVAWITERKDVLSLFWGLLSMLAYERYARDHRRRSYVLAAVFLAIGLMAKSLLVTLPFLFLVLDYWPLQRWQAAGARRGRLVAEKIPFLILVIISSLATLLAQSREGAVAEDVVLAPPLRLANAVVAYARYLVQFVWPHDQAYIYVHPNLPGGTPLTAAQIVLAGVLLIAISAVVWVLRRHRGLTVGWLWFLGTMVPMIGLIQVGTQALADRYAYLPFIGLYIMVVWGVGALVQTGPVGRNEKKAPLTPNVAGALAVVALLGLGVAAHRQVGAWRDSITLGSRAIAAGANDPKVHYNLATALSRAGRFQEAVPYYETTVRLKPDHARAYNNLGRTLNQLGKGREAVVAFDRALAIDPDFTLAYVNKSNALATAQQWAAAIDARRRAVALEPNNLTSRLALGRMLASSGQLKAAITEFETVLARAPGNQEAGRNLKLARDLLSKHGDSSQ